MSKNYIFHKFECGLSKEETAKLCFKSVRTFTSWGGGKEIPPECKRLMRMYARKELSIKDEWKEFYIQGEKLLLPTGQLVSPLQIITTLK